MARRMLTKRGRELLQIARSTPLSIRDQEPADRKLLGRFFQHGWVNFAGYAEPGKPTYETTPEGVAELRRPAPPAAPGRVKCVNPICTVSAAQDKFPGCDSIICNKCFKMTGDLRTEYRSLQATARKIRQRRARQRNPDGTTQVHLSELGLDRRIERNWAAIVQFFNSPERPEGLDGFLEEMGWEDGRVPDEKLQADDRGG